MKCKCAVIMLISGFLSYSQAEASLRPGVGFVLGDPSGLTGKVFINDNNAVDAGIGPSARDGFYLYTDYLRVFTGLFPVRELSFYLGAGAGFHRRDRDRHPIREKKRENSLEVRVPFGLEYMLNQIPIGLFIELAPALEVIPDIDFRLRGGFGARYYF